MLKTTLIAAGALAAAAFFTLPAQAGHSGASVSISGPGVSIHIGTPGYGGHGHWGRHHVLPPDVVAHRLHRQGFRRLHGLRLRGDVYVARAQSWRGEWVRVSASAYTGEVFAVRPARW